MKRILFALCLLLACQSIKAQTIAIASPNGRHEAEVAITTVDNRLQVHYSTRFDGKEVIRPSRLDLEMDNLIWEQALARDYSRHARWFDALRYTSHERIERDTTWQNPYGERSTVHEAYQGVIVHFARPDKSGYRLDIELRAYNEGVAFRYHLPQHPNAFYHRLKAEQSEFSLPEGTMAWHAAWAQAPYTRIALEGWEQSAERPLTLELPDGRWAAIGEAAVVDFPRGKLHLSPSKPCTLITELNDNATDLVTPYTMPWRVIMVAESAGKLLESNDIFLHLNAPSAIADQRWIKPGKIMRETRLTTENAMAVIDFCAAHKMQYLLFDWKWYGPADDFKSDASIVIPQLDMPRVVAYGREKGIGIWLYINQHALQTDAERLFPIYEKWGIAGLKFGFVHFTSQHWADWVHGLVRLAAKHHLMVNIHDEYRPTGYSRTYPNLLTQEGIRGNEEFPSATHNTLLPFTRMLCGAGDYTVCYFDPRLKNSHAHQLALPVVFFSPLQTLYWYDTPARIREVEELEFFDNVPVVWDETRVIDDSMGEHIAIARRAGEEWFVGILGGDQACTVSYVLDFLQPDTDYVLRSYTDDPNADTPTHVRCQRHLIRNNKAVTLRLQARGGAALHLLPATKADQRQYKKWKN